MQVLDRLRKVEKCIKDKCARKWVAETNAWKARLLGMDEDLLTDLQGSLCCVLFLKLGFSMQISTQVPNFGAAVPVAE